MASPQRLLLIDGYSTIFRAFYAIRNLSNSRGEPTNAVYGFIQMLRKLLRDEQPELVGIALDVSRQTFRSERFADYKANRAPMPDDLRVQLPYVRRAIEGFRIPILERAGYEADDLIGSLARRAVEAGYQVVVVTADKDMMQLVGPGVSLYHTGREKLYDAAAVEQDFGVPPAQVPDVLALMGDSVDNVPGVPGIGEKGAKGLIQEYGSLEALIERAPEVKRKSYREGLLEHREQALMSKELATIDTEVAIELDPAALRREEPDGQALFELYRELDFFSLLEELESDGLTAAQRSYPLADDSETAEEWRRRTQALPARRCAAMVGDPETIAVVVAVPGGTPVLADCRRDGLAAAAAATLREWLADAEVEIIGHDLKEVVRFAYRDAEGPGGPPAGAIRARLTDTMLLAYLLRSALRGYSLAEVAFERFQHRVQTPDQAGLGGPEPPLCGLDELRGFAAERALLPAELADVLLPELSASTEGDPGAVYDQIERPLLPVLVRLEDAGVALDVEYLGRMSEELGAEIASLERQIYELAGEEFNINSTQQLGTILFDKLGYPGLRRTKKTKSYSTSAAILEELAARGFDLPRRLLEYREFTKLKSTYVDALPQVVDAAGRLHTRFQQAVAATGRLSSTNPNLQNIPVRSEVGQRIRKAFRAEAGHLLLVADYSQIELRVLAHIAREEALIAAFRDGQDIHRTTAASVFGVAAELVTDQQRRAAKTINFGILYGMSAFGLGQRLGIPAKDARSFIDAYFSRFSRIRGYMEETFQQVERDGFVETLYGRCRYLPDIHSKNRNLRENAKRMAINARIQGTAADLLKLAMIAADRRLASDFPRARLLLTVHDELVAEAPLQEAAAAGAALVEEMEGVADLVVPLRVDLGVGATWYDAKS